MNRVVALALCAILLAAVASLSGCVSAQSQADLARDKAAALAYTPTCSSPRQCEGMWAAARNWVSSSCEMKIQTMSDSYIETYNSQGMLRACRVTRDPLPAGGYSFHVAISYENPFMDPAWKYVANFEATLRDAGAAFGATP